MDRFINVGLISNWQNWAIILLMIFIGGLAISAIFPQIHLPKP